MVEEIKLSLQNQESPSKTVAKEAVLDSPIQKKPLTLAEVKPGVLPAQEKPEKIVEFPGEGVSIQGGVKAVKKKPPSELWIKIEKQFIENWTGIVGALVMVMGVSFLGIYAALKLKPFYRFIMIALCSGLLFASYLFLRMRSMWLKVASWIRSSSGAILLFACLGAGGIEGLKWVYDPLYALILLSAGIAVNLTFGFAGKSQVFASFHVILSLVAIGIAPQSIVTLIITGIVVFIGVVMSYRDRWEYHLLITITAFLVFEFIWYFSQGLSPSTISLTQKLTGILVTAAIGITACLVHYRKLYSVQKFELLPFVAHLINWLYMTAGFILYSTGSKWNTIILGCAAIAAAILSRYARRLRIRWLFTTDSLVAQSIAIFALFTMGRWNVDLLLIIAMIYIEIFLFLAIMIIEKEILLRRIGVYLHYLSGSAIIIAAIVHLDHQNVTEIITNSVILSVIIIIESLFHLYSVKHKNDAIDVIHFQRKDQRSSLSVGGIMIPLFLLTFFAFIVQYPWAGSVIAVIGAFFIFQRQKLQSNGLAVGLLIFLVGVHIMSWRHAYLDLWGNIGEITIYNLPIFVISLAGITFSYFDDLKKCLKWPCIYIFTAHLIIFSYFVTVTVSPYLPGVLWILLSVPYLQISIYLKERPWDTEDKGEPSRFIFLTGCILVLLFIIRHVAVHMQPGPYIGFLQVRFIIEIFALLVFSYWALAKLPEIKRHDIIWKIQALSWEVFLFFLVFTLALEVPTKWHPLAWMLSGLAIFFAGIIFSDKLSRFRFYSILFYWAACLHVAFISSSETTPSNKMADQAWLGAVIAQVFQFFYMIVYYRKNGLHGIDFPFSFTLFKKLIIKMQKRQTIWIYYPFFIAVALFLFWTFDRSVLTLLWVMESFSLFILSIILKESHFRYVSMAALSGCLVRLVFFDLAQSGTIMRAIVFLCVGLIMLLMNILYTKYRDRFEKS